MKPLRLVLTDHWFEEIKSGRKTSEYRVDGKNDFWFKRLKKCNINFTKNPIKRVVFQKAYRKNPELMEFEMENIIWHASGMDTDLKTPEAVFEIKLGRRVK